MNIFFLFESDYLCAGANISKALDSRLIGRNYLPSRINWVVQSTAVDFLHLLLSSIEWFFVQFNIKVCHLSRKIELKLFLLLIYLLRVGL